MEPKPWYLSKVLWANLIGLLLEIGQAFTGVNIVPAGTLMIIMNVLNILLRFITKQPIGTAPTTPS